VVEKMWEKGTRNVKMVQWKKHERGGLKLCEYVHVLLHFWTWERHISCDEESGVFGWEKRKRHWVVLVCFEVIKWMYLWFVLLDPLVVVGMIDEIEGYKVA